MSMKNIMDRILDKTTNLTEVATEIREAHREKNLLGKRQFEPRNDGKVFSMEVGELFNGHWYKYEADAEVRSRQKVLYEVIAECCSESILENLRELRKGFGRTTDHPSIPALLESARSDMVDFSTRIVFGDLHHHLPSYETIVEPETSVVALSSTHLYVSLMAFYFPGTDQFDILAGVGRWTKVPDEEFSSREVLDYRRYCTD